MPDEAPKKDRTTLCITLKSGRGFWIGNSHVTVEGIGKIKVRIAADRTALILRDEVKRRNQPEGDSP